MAGERRFEGFRAFPSPDVRSCCTSQQRSRWDGGRRDAGLYVRHVSQRSKVGAREGRPFPFMKGSDLLLDLHPTETKCQYC